MNDKILKQDIIIPAGTRFASTPRSREYSQAHHEVVIGLTPGTSGVFTYFVDSDDPEIWKYFRDVVAADDDILTTIARAVGEYTNAEAGTNHAQNAYKRMSEAYEDWCAVRRPSARGEQKL